jgi:hypothetical protein
MWQNMAQTQAEIRAAAALRREMVARVMNETKVVGPKPKSRSPSPEAFRSSRLGMNGLPQDGKRQIQTPKCRHHQIRGCLSQCTLPMDWISENFQNRLPPLVLLALGSWLRAGSMRKKPSAKETQQETRNLRSWLRRWEKQLP